MSTNTLQNPQQELRTLALEILEWADANDMTKAELLRQFPELGSDKTLGSIAANRMEELAVDKWLEAYRAVVDKIAPGEEENADPLYDDLSTTKAVRAQFTRLKMSRTSAKLVIVEGNTGMGKTSAGKIIIRKMRELNPVAGIYTLEASSGWGDRSNAMVSAMLKALGMPDAGSGAAGKLDKLVEALNARPVVFIVDEIHDVGVRCLRVIKTLLNLTTVKIVLLTHPRLFRDLERQNWDDVGQLTGNRLVARVNLGSVTEGDVALILSRRMPILNGLTKEAAAGIARAASGNGNFAFVREVIVRLQRLQQKTGADHLTAEDVETQIRAELKARKAAQLTM